MSRRRIALSLAPEAEMRGGPPRSLPSSDPHAGSTRRLLLQRIVKVETKTERLPGPTAIRSPTAQEVGPDLIYVTYQSICRVRLAGLRQKASCRFSQPGDHRPRKCLSALQSQLHCCRRTTPVRLRPSLASGRSSCCCSRSAEGLLPILRSGRMQWRGRRKARGGRRRSRRASRVHSPR